MTQLTGFECPGKRLRSGHAIGRTTHALVILCLGVGTLLSGEIRGRWSTLPSAPTVRQEVAFAVLESRLFVIGGLAGGRAVEAYNAATHEWESFPDLPIDVHHGSAAVLDGKLYSVGGFGSGGNLFSSPVANVFEFDPARDSWEPRASLPLPRGALMSLALNGRIYAIGGRDRRDSVTTMTAYDPASDSWESVAPMPTPLDHLAAAVTGGKIYVAGGRLTRNGSFTRNDRTLAIYDPVVDGWQLGTPLPTARSGHAAAAIAGFLLVLGGEIPGVNSANEAYDPVNDRWFRLDDLPTARHGMGVGTIGTQVITAAGGLVAGIAPSGVTESFSVLAVVESLAQFATGPNISSQLVVSNPGETAVTVRAELHDSNGDDLEFSFNDAATSVLQAQIEPGGVQVFTAPESSDFHTGGVALFSDAPILSNVLFSSSQGFAGVAGTAPGRRFFVSVLRSLDEQLDSGLAVADVSGLPNTVTLILLNESGEVETQSQRQLAPFGQFSQLFDELWDIEILRLVFNGSIRIEAEHEVGAVAILLRGSQFATLPVRPIED